MSDRIIEMTPEKVRDEFDRLLHGLRHEGGDLRQSLADTSHVAAFLQRALASGIDRETALKMVILLQDEEIRRLRASVRERIEREGWPIRFPA